VLRLSSKEEGELGGLTPYRGRIAALDEDSARTYPPLAPYRWCGALYVDSIVYYENLLACLNDSYETRRKVVTDRMHFNDQAETQSMTLFTQYDSRILSSQLSSVTSTMSGYFQRFEAYLKTQPPPPPSPPTDANADAVERGEGLDSSTGPDSTSRDSESSRLGEWTRKTLKNENKNQNEDKNENEESKSSPTIVSRIASATPVALIKNVQDGALDGVRNVTRTLESVTVGSYYSVSSTGFITFKTRFAKCVSYQTLLSHDYFQMAICDAPSPKDIQWSNIATQRSQISNRIKIADICIIGGAILWSVLVSAINASSNIDQFDKLGRSVWYDLLDAYFGATILLIVISVLPLLFELIARFYEGRKLESDIQNSVLKRYFMYQVANVYVTVTSEAIYQEISRIVESPGNLFDALGKNLPGASITFANILIVKIFTSLPLELLRVWPFLVAKTVKFFTKKEKLTRRDMRSGALGKYPFDYGNRGDICWLSCFAHIFNKIISPCYY
jgi:hypothetical protein